MFYQNSEDMCIAREDCKRLETIAEPMIGKKALFYEQAAQAMRSKEYCCGSMALSGGYYCLDPIEDLVVGGVRRGRLYKKKPSNREVDYEYWLDAYGKPILIIQNPDKPRFNQHEFIFCNEEEVLGITYDSAEWLGHIMECKYLDGHLHSYSFSHYDQFQKKIMWHEKKVFSYVEDGLLFSADLYTYAICAPCAEKSPLLTHSKYVFDHDENGYLSSHQVIEYNRNPEGEMDPNIYRIQKKRKL